MSSEKRKRITQAMLIELAKVCGYEAEKADKLEWADDGDFWWLLFVGDGDGLLFFPAGKPGTVRGCISVIEQFAVPVLPAGKQNRLGAYEFALAHAKWLALGWAERAQSAS